MSVDIRHLMDCAAIDSITHEEVIHLCDHIKSQAAEIDDIRKKRDALRAAVLAIDSLRGPFMSDDDIASVWKLVDTALSGEST